MRGKIYFNPAIIVTAMLILLPFFSVSETRAAPESAKIYIYKGWNMISSPFEEPLILPRVAQQCKLTIYKDEIWAWGYNPTNGWHQLSQVGKDEGVYLLSEEDCTVELTGTPITSPSQTLKRGWNLIPGISGKSFEKAQGDCQIPRDHGIWILDSKTQQWSILEKTDKFERGKSYWLAVEKDCALNKQKPDLDVTFISRTPRYERYDVCYQPSGYNPYFCESQKKYVQRWPKLGKTVTFTANVKNNGGESSGSFDYEWRVNGDAQKSGTIMNLEPEANVTNSLDWTWPDGSHLIEFIVDKSNTVAEVSENNNKIGDYSDALSFRLHVEKSVYEEFNKLRNFLGSYSFEDWAQGHIQKIRSLFSDAGVKEKIRIDEILIESDGSLPKGETHTPWDLYVSKDILWDGRWGFIAEEWPASVVQKRVTGIQPELIHELIHQLGIIDSYGLNFDWQNAPNNQAISNCALCDSSKYKCGDKGDGVKIKEFENCVYRNPNLQDIMMDTTALKLSPFVAGALNKNLGYRRGYFGEYLYDVPGQNTVKILGANSAPVTNAEIYFYQSDGCKITSSAKFAGRTDDSGYFTLPNRKIPSPVLTETKHALRDNPFGNIDVTGCNGVFLIKIVSNGKIDYQWMDISMFNLAYWSGNTDSATYTIVADGL